MEGMEHSYFLLKAFSWYKSTFLFLHIKALSDFAKQIFLGVHWCVWSRWKYFLYR